MGQKLPSHNYGSTGLLTEYRIAENSKPWGTHISLINVLWEFSMDLVVLAMFAESFPPSFKNV